MMTFGCFQVSQLFYEHFLRVSQLLRKRMLPGLPVTIISPKGLEFPMKTNELETKRNEAGISQNDEVVNEDRNLSVKLGKFKPVTKATKVKLALSYGAKWPNIMQTQRNVILLGL